MNSQYAIGRIGQDTVHSIWNGARVAALRAAIDGGDFSHGCLDCREAHEAGHRERTQAVEFDRLVGAGTDMWPRRLEFALSNTCNLRCVMCNGELSSSIRSREGRPPIPDPYGQSFIDEIAEFAPHAVEMAFLGGEPMLGRRTLQIWDLLLDRGLRPAVHVTTNGTLLTPRIEDYVRRLAMHVSVSIDGATAGTNESVRLGVDHSKVIEHYRRLRQITAESGGSVSINTCVMPANWDEFPDLLLSAENDGVRVTAIVVTYPRSMSLLHLPVDERRRVLAALEDRSPELEGRLQINSGAWESTVARIRDSLEGTSTSVHVSLPAGRPRPESISEALGRLIEGVHLETGIAPAVIDVADDVVRTVDAPDWAAWLRLDLLRGESFLRILPLLSERLGFRPQVSVETIGLGLSRTEMTASGDGWTARFTSLMGEWDDGDQRRARIALVCRDDVVSDGDDDPSGRSVPRNGSALESGTP